MVLLNGMKHDAVSIDQAGRIVLPKNVRQELAIKSGDTFKVSVQGMAVTLTPNKTGSGFVRKGKALVFATAGEEMLSEATAQEILSAGRAEHESKSVAGLVSRGQQG
jgi:AbrB family looped-hinge helix DNA binding protein